MKNPKTFYVLILLCCILLSNCKKRDTPTTNPENDQPNILKENVVIINEENISSLIAVDSVSLSFDASSGIVSSLTTGQILVSGITDKAPNGFLRKIISTSSSNNVIQCQTEPATLDDLFDAADIDFSMDISPSDTLAKSTSTEFSIDIPDKVLYDNDNDHSTTNDQIKATLNVKYTLTNFALKLKKTKGNKVHHFESSINVKENSSLYLFAGGDVTVPLMPKKLKKYPLKPITIWVPVGALTVPIVINNSVEFDVKFEADGRFGYAYNNTSSYKLGVKFENGIPEKIYEPTIESTGDEPLKANFEWKVQAGIMGSVDIVSRPYNQDVFRNKIGISVGIRGDIDTTLNPDYRFYLHGDIHDSVSLFWGAGSFQINYIFLDKTIKEGNFPFTTGGGGGWGEI